MDRNIFSANSSRAPPVALRKESVDRNAYGRINDISRLVALRKESVDRNPTIKAMRGDRKASLSARRAWIEIIGGSRATTYSTVALRKESVDRNCAECLKR